MSLEVIRKVNDSVLILKINGLLDYSTIDRFNPNIPDHISTVIVDLSDLDFIDSTGIGAVLSILYETSERGIILKFEGLNETVTEIFDTVGVFQIMKSLLKEGEERCFE
jgi:anti-anti-sigma factor